MSKTVIETITGYGYDGEGVCRVNGKVCFVPFTLRDEKVKFKITKDTSSFSRGEVVDVVTPSGCRMNAPCPYFGKCGGCTYQHTTHQNELNIKKEVLLGQLRKLNFNKDVKVFASPKEYNYRNKIKLFVDNNKIGLKLRGTNIICEIDECLIASEVINKAIKTIRTFLIAQKLFDYYSQVVIRSEENVCIVNFYMKKFKNVNYQGLYLMLGSNYGIYQTYNHQPEYKIGQKEIEINRFGLDCKFSVNSFHQVNDDIEKILYQHVAQAVKGKKIVNCYSGGGVLSGIIALGKNFVTGIELGKSEHEDAERLKDENNLIYLKNIQGDCAEILPKVNSDVETIIVDPPRAGMDKKVVQAVDATNAQRLIYISCNSATFVRDAQGLKSYNLKEVKLFDMFPRTGEYEILAIFDKNN